MKRLAWIGAAAGLFGLLLVAIGIFPRFQEARATAACHDAPDCGSCCSAHGAHMSSNTPGTPGSCACLLTAQDSVFAAPVLPTQPVLVVQAPTGDRTLGSQCTTAAECSAGVGCLRFDDRGSLINRQASNGALQCSRQCGAGCPGGFHCSSLTVPVTGGQPVVLDACGRDAPP